MFTCFAGKIESTEPIYKYHMQVQGAVPEPSPKLKDGPLKNNLKPRRSRNPSDTSSVTSHDDTHPKTEAAVPTVNHVPEVKQ